MFARSDLSDCIEYIKIIVDIPPLLDLWIIEQNVHYSTKPLHG